MNSIEAISERWCEEGRKYVAGINEYVHKGMALGWDKVGESPEDIRRDLAKKVIEFVRQANEAGNIEGLRQKFPPAHAPFLELLKENGQHLGPVALLDDGRILLRVGAPYQEGSVYIINELNVSPVENIISFGRSSNRKFFALAKQSEIEIYEGWEGHQIASRQDEFILGDAYGYLRAVNKNGGFCWQHFIASSIGDIDISQDEKTLIVSTYAGFLSIIKLDISKTDPYTIGTATHQEIRRWLFWKKEKKPLAW